jgi:glycosyltransferase involved in cell wall biosynthesis
MGTSEPLVSVVTPVYDMADYLRECVESVLGQTWRRWELLIVDNRSTDGTLELARALAERDGRIRVLAPEEFVPALVNANRALRQIHPEAAYVKVLHADDWLYTECLEKMVRLAEGNPSVGIVGAYRMEGDRVTLKGLPEAQTVFEGRALARDALLGRIPYVFGSPSSVLMRADLVRARPRFYNPDTPFQADQEACYELLAESDFGFVHEVLTYTRRHDEAGFPYYARVGANIPGQIDLILRFGRLYLTDREFASRLAAWYAMYGLFFVRRARSLRNREFRAYHRSALTKLARMTPPLAVLRGTGLQARRLVRL